VQGVEIQETILAERQRHFIQAMSRSIDGRPVTRSERALRESIFQALLRGQGVSELIGVKPPRNKGRRWHGESWVTPRV